MTKGVWKTFNVINGMPWIVVEFCRYKRIVEMMTYFLLLHKLHDVMHTFFIIIVFFFIVDVSINIQIWNLITENIALNKPARADLYIFQYTSVQSGACCRRSKIWSVFFWTTVCDIRSRAINSRIAGRSGTSYQYSPRLYTVHEGKYDLGYGFEN